VLEVGIEFKLRLVSRRPVKGYIYTFDHPFVDVI
jgi:hypothetical protein